MKKAMKFNWLTEEIARREGKNEQINICQIKEITKITLDILANSNDAEVEALLDKYRIKMTVL